ncbi:MAG: ATP-binding protein [Ferrovum myxofaciens]
MACALAQYACRRGFSATYLRSHACGKNCVSCMAAAPICEVVDATCQNRCTGIGRLGMGAIDSATRSDLLEIIDDRSATRATILTSQLPIEHWHAWIGDATIADALLDRVMQRHHRFTLTGESLRRGKTKEAQSEVSGTDPGE